MVTAALEGSGCHSGEEQLCPYKVLPHIWKCHQHTCELLPLALPLAISGRSLQESGNKVGPKTDPRGMPNLTRKGIKHQYCLQFIKEKIMRNRVKFLSKVNKHNPNCQVLIKCTPLVFIHLDEQNLSGVAFFYKLMGLTRLWADMWNIIVQETAVSMCFLPEMQSWGICR